MVLYRAGYISHFIFQIKMTIKISFYQIHEYNCFKLTNYIEIEYQSCFKTTCQYFVFKGKRPMRTKRTRSFMNVFRYIFYSNKDLLYNKNVERFI